MPLDGATLSLPSLPYIGNEAICLRGAMAIRRRKEFVHRVCVRDVEQMPGAGDHAIGTNKTQRNEAIAVAVDMMDRHR